MAIRIIGSPQPKTSTGEDVARSGVAGVLEGLASIPGQIGDVREMMLHGADWVQSHIPGAQNAPKVSDLARDAGRGPLATQILSGAAQALAQKAGADPGLARAASAALPGQIVAAAPTTHDIINTATQGRGTYQPQTKWGERAKNVAQFAPAAAATPGTAAQRLAAAILPGVASQAAGELTQGTTLEPAARIVGAAAGGLGAARLGVTPGDSLLSSASRNASDEQIAAATQLMRQAQAEGVNLTMAEALQRVTAGATGMGRLQRVVEGTKAGSERIAPVMAERPGQVRQAVANVADTIAPATDQPSVIGLQGQRAAEGVLRNAEQARTAHVNPLYEVADQQHVHPAAMEGLLADLDAEIGADRTGIIGGPLSELRDRLTDVPARPATAGSPAARTPGFLSADIPASPGNPGSPRVPLTDLGNLDRVRKYVRDRMAMPPLGSDAITKEQAGRLGYYLDRLDGLMERVPEFQQGKQAYEAFTGAVNDPLTAGPLGRIAGSEDVGAQVGALYPSRPLEGGAAETRQALQLMGDIDPAAGPALTRQHLMSTLNEATQDNVGGPNQWGGAKFAAAIAGNPEQAQALTGGVDVVGGDAQRLGDLLDVLRATGYRERPGSMTAYNTKDLEELGKAGMSGEVLRTGLNPPGIFRRLGEGFQDWQTERNAGRLAEAILADPDEAARILTSARQRVPYDPHIADLERLAIAAQGAQRAQSAPPGP